MFQTLEYQVVDDHLVRQVLNGIQLVVFLLIFFLSS